MKKIKVTNCSDSILHLPAPFNLVLSRGKSAVVVLKDSEFAGLRTSLAFTRLVAKRLLVIQEHDLAEVVSEPVAVAAPAAEPTAEAPQKEPEAKAAEEPKSEPEAPQKEPEADPAPVVEPEAEADDGFLPAVLSPKPVHESELRPLNIEPAASEPAPSAPKKGKGKKSK